MKSKFKGGDDDEMKSISFVYKEDERVNKNTENTNCISVSCVRLDRG